MANKNIIPPSAKVAIIEQQYLSPVLVVQGYNIPIGTTYCFLAKADPWTDEANPPVPTSDQKYMKQVMKNMFVAKLLTTSEISPVLQRIDWESGVVYDYYKDDVNMVELDSNGYLIRNFYVKNKYDQVFKCLWNNTTLDEYDNTVLNASTVEPYFQPGTYNTNNIFQGADKYKWKYIYTIDTGLKVKFMDKAWMPVGIGTNTPNTFDNTAGRGSIDVINITSVGSGYDPANAIISVTITGDGTGAAAVANVSLGSVADVIVTNPGTNYTYANVAIVSSIGSGAMAFSPTSPIGGHGFDPVSDLGCSHVMFTTEFNGSEGGVIPTDIDYHQIGLIVNPTSAKRWLQAQNDGAAGPYPANSSIYKTSTDLTVAPGFGVYTPDEIIYQGSTDSIDNATFIARVLSFDPATNVLRLINTTGTPTNNSPVRNDSRTNRTLLSYTTPDFSPFSGYISFLENRTGVQRSSDGIEQIRIVLGY
jgi:hypothetical protein